MIRYTIFLPSKIMIRGAGASISGKNYEKELHKNLKKCMLNGKPFNTQHENTLGGSTSNNDLSCNLEGVGDIGIEAKKLTPDWMQCSIKFNTETNKWDATPNSKNPIECGKIFNELINNFNLYGGDIPPFMKRSVTHEEWKQIKKQTNQWNDTYIDIPSDTIRNLYSKKGCQYIQISNGYGLFHLGGDPCKFGVPIFDIEQQIRVRTKIHTRKNSKGYCSLSVTAACQPKNIKQLQASQYSLDNIGKLPPNLHYTISNSTTLL